MWSGFVQLLRSLEGGEGRHTVMSAHFFLLLFPFLGSLLGLGLEEEVMIREAWVMGTRMKMVVEGGGAEAFRNITEAALEEVERVEGVLSTWDPRSPLSQANQAPPHAAVSLSRELAGLLEEALAWTDRTGGAFDPAVGALIDAWDLRGAGCVPEPQALEAARTASGSHLFLLREGAVPSMTRITPAAWLDSGAFGKGAGLRAAADRIRPPDTFWPEPTKRADAAGTEARSGARGPRILLDLGGQIWAWGGGANPWQVAVAHPLRRHEPVQQLSVHDVSVATSGTSERWVQVDGARFGHILDPRSGMPAPAWGSVTVVSRDPMVADILSTALYVMGPEKGLKWVRHRPGIGALFLEACQEGLRATWNEAMEEWLTGLPLEDQDFLAQHKPCTTFSHQGGGFS